MVREIKMLRDWFGCVFVIFLNVPILRVLRIYSHLLATFSFNHSLKIDIPSRALIAK